MFVQSNLHVFCSKRQKTHVNGRTCRCANITAAFLRSGYACPNSKFIKSQGALSGLSADYQRFPLGLRLDSKTMFSGTSAIFIFGSLSVLM